MHFHGLTNLGDRVLALPEGIEPGLLDSPGDLEADSRMTVGEKGAPQDFFLGDEMPARPFPLQNVEVPFGFFVA